jgi:hypothetical protein
MRILRCGTDDDWSKNNGYKYNVVDVRIKKLRKTARPYMRHGGLSNGISIGRNVCIDL